MSRIVSCRTSDGRTVEFEERIGGSGTMKDVHFSPDRSCVVAFYRDPPDRGTRERLEMITGAYREGIFAQAGGAYWKDLFCWPEALVEYQGRLGLTMPVYPSNFFFQYGSKDDDILGIRGKEKEGKWFASAHLRARFLDPRELGTWKTHLLACLELARAVRRMHMAGLAHSDLSYKNCLIDPMHGRACLIDLDGLVVPGKYPPNVIGTPDFIAPEVVQSAHLALGDPARSLPRRETDLHALAVLLYMYLLYRHPLRGGQVHDAQDEQRDETLTMGERALFIENPHNRANRIRLDQAQPTELPWADTARLPFTLTGPYLAPLFEQAFVTGLHAPAQRPSANDWETALVRTLDLLIPCQNPSCAQGWHVYDNSLQPRCPFCNTPFHGRLPVLNLYSSRQAGAFRPDQHRVLVWAGQTLHAWHANRTVQANEKLAPELQRPVASFEYHDSLWWLVNENLPDLRNVTTRETVPIGGRIELQDGQQILLDASPGGRLVVVQMVEP